MPNSLVDRILGADVDYVSLAVPLFFTLAGVEFLVAWFARIECFRLNDSIADLGCGILDQTLKLFVHAAALAGYISVYENWGLFDVEALPAGAKWLAALLLFLGVDLCFYWHHRLAHEFSIGWATHVVHHQSEEFNLIVALRQSALEHYLMAFCYLPLALFGFPPTWYVAMFAFNLIWQFWCHTRLVGKLGPLEWVFNTPSHHRVHHGRNPKYLDKNYAGTLIVWDRMFGTFQPEEEEPVYGITRPFQSWNPLWANLYYWVELAKEAYHAPFWWDKVRIWFMPLGWTPRGLPEKPRAQEVTRETVVKYDERPPRGVMIYILIQFLGVLVLGLHLTEEGEQGPLRPLVPLALLVVGSLLVLGGLLDRRRWAFSAELVRLACLLVIVGPIAFREVGAAGAWGLAALGALSAVWIVAFRSAFLSGRERPTGESPSASSPAAA